MTCVDVDDEILKPARADVDVRRQMMWWMCYDEDVVLEGCAT